MDALTPATFSPVKTRGSVGRAKARLLNWLDGVGQEHELLPSERVLAKSLGLDRGTLRRALKRVEAEGRLVREGRRLIDAARASDSHRPWVSQAIAVLLPPPLPSDEQHWARFVTLGISEAVRDAGCHALTINAERLSERDLSPLVASRPLGVLMPEHFCEQSAVRRVAGAFADAAIPVVAYGDDPELKQYDRVCSDHEHGSYELTRWLLDQKRRPVRFWTKPWSWWWLEERSKGYERAFREAGLAPPEPCECPVLGKNGRTQEEFDHHARQTAGFLVDVLRGADPADALMVTSDRVIFYAAAAVRLMRLEPGRDVLITGYDNYWEVCEERKFSHDRPAASVDKHNEQTGRAMLHLLMERIAGQLPVGPAIRRIKPELCTTNA